MTIGALAPAYRYLLALHVISVIVWMAGMIVLPAIYAHQAPYIAGGGARGRLC